MPEIELHQLNRPYETLRIASKARQRYLLSSLATDGQQTPVLVIEQSEGNYVLIDGYQRVAALEQLGRDTVDAIVVALDEASALIFVHRQGQKTRRSAVEDAWLLQVLTEQYGLNQHELALRLGHTTSWISRRLGLLTVLPESVQELVQRGQLPSYPSMKYMVPLARANSADCEKLAANLAGHQLSTRQMERLYVAWRTSDEETRARLVDKPLLFLKATKEMEQAKPPHPDAELAKDLETLGTMSRRVARRLSRRRPELEVPKELALIQSATRTSINALMGLMKEKFDARQRSAQDRLAPASRQGNGETSNRQSAKNVAQHGA